MVRHILMSESGTVLRTMFIADMLADAVPAAGASRGGSKTPACKLDGGKLLILPDLEKVLVAS